MPERAPVVAAALGLGAAVGAFGFVFGVGAVSAGGSVAQACAMSLLVFTGASQFSAVSVVAAGGTMTAALGGAMLLAARNAVYGLAMSRVIQRVAATPVGRGPARHRREHGDVVGPGGSASTDGSRSGPRG